MASAKKRTWINSIVVVSAKKTNNKSTGTTLSMLKIYSSCLICILKVKYTSLFYTRFVCWPAVRPGSTMARAPVFSHNNSNRVGFTKLLFRRTFIHCAMVLPFILY